MKPGKIAFSTAGPPAFGIVSPLAAPVHAKDSDHCFSSLKFGAKNMKKIISAFVIGALMTIGIIGLMTASSTVADAQGQPEGVFVSGIQPGIITAVSGNHITIRNGEGEVYDIIVQSNARLNRDGSPIKLANVGIGDSLGAAGWLDGRTLRAAGVTIGDGKVLQSLFDNQKKNAENAGKTLVIGNVTAIDNNKLIVKRTDNVVQAIEVDGNTSFKSGARTGLAGAALIDVKVGGMITAAGSLKDNVFVAKEIYLIPTQ